MSIEAMKKALEALKDANALFNVEASSAAYKEAVTALRQAIKEAALKGLSQTSREIEDIPCKDHPDAPHGFLRDESHSSGRYVCECEAWEPDDMAHRSGGLSVEQEPVAWCTDDYATDKSATTYSKEMAERWVEKGWSVTALYTAIPDDLLRQSEREGWRWAKECEAEVKRLRELVDSQKPAMWMLSKGQEPPKREWVGLSDTESEIYGNQFSGSRLVKAIEALLRERNT
jgi:hypothetical protein